jgi:glycosyltransferase involved in cell wall biosynthesis
LVGYALSRFYGIPLILEYGDPWAFNVVERRSWLRFWLERTMESRVLKSAGAVVVTTEETKENYLKNYPFLDEDEVYVMPAGVDYSDYENLVPQKSEKFRILFTGRMYQIADINPLLEALTRIAGADDEIRNNLEVLFVGDIDQEHRDLLKAYDLGKMVLLHDFVPLREALSLSLGADVLLFLGNKGGLQVPSRLFSYLAAGRPILCIKGDDKDPALRFLRGGNRGLIVGNKVEEIRPAIIELYKLYESRRLEEAFDLSPLPELFWQNRVRILDVACESAMRGYLRI